MSWNRWFGRELVRGSSLGFIRGCRIRKRSQHRLKPTVLGLEGRRLLTFHVTSTADDGTTGTLRWAVQQADAATSPSTIDFRLGDAAATITLSQGELELSNTTETITIDGPGANLLSINANRDSRVFQIDAQVTAFVSGLTITGGSTTRNGGGNGGGVSNDGTATLTECTIEGNSSGYGGGLFSQGALRLADCTISGNSATIEGGGAWVSGTAELIGCAISGNASADIGGGLNNRSASLTLTACTVSGNSAQTLGGAIYNEGTAAIEGCTLSGNTARNGGGLVTGLSAMSRLANCTLSGNTALHGAGVESYSTTTLSNCTLSGNVASVSGGGVSNSGTVTLTSCTLSGNSAAASGGGLYNHDFIDNRGVIVLTDTIVAGNTGAGGASSDIAGIESGRVTGSFNLIGNGGSGGIQGGEQGNIVLNSPAGLGLAPLGEFGGPTQTVALLPGSPAIGAGTELDGVATDQRGEPLDLLVDIGAFQSQGFILTAAPGATPQSAPTGEAFANPLAATVTARNPVEPVEGGIVSFTVTPDDGGAGANLSAATAVIGADGRAQVSATANASTGTYTVTVSAAGALPSDQFALTNIANDLVALTFSGLVERSVTFGTATVTFTGTLAHGAQLPPAGETVAIALGGVTHQAVIAPDGSFLTTFDTGALAVAASPFTITYTYTSDGIFASVAAHSFLTVTKATPTVLVTDAGGANNGSAVFGQPVTFVASVAAAGIPSGSITFFDGAVALSEVPLDGSGRATLTGSLPVGSHSITASYSGDQNLLGKTSGFFTESVARAGTRLVLTRQPVLKKKNIVSIRLTAELDPLAPGQGIASGTVKFLIRKKTLGTVALAGGRATLTFKLNSVLNKRVTVVYSGDTDFQPSQALTPVLTRAFFKVQSPRP